jgi:tetratricopeptide (TPR) repeat protein
MLGVEFSTEELEGVMQELERVGSPPETQLDASIGVRRLAESGLLVRHRGGRVGFRHSLLRDSVYQGVPAAQRETIHRAAYDHFKRQDRMPEATRMPQMAYHAARSGLKEEAGHLYLTLANGLLARHAYLDAESCYRTAMENLPDTDDKGHITAARGRGLMRFRIGRYEDAAKDLSLALERARKVGARLAQIDILLDQGIALDMACDYKVSATITEEAEALAKDEVLPDTVRARLLMGVGRSPYRAEKLIPAVELLNQAVAAAEPLGDDGYEAYTQSLMMLIFALTNLGRFEEARTLADRLMKVAESHNDSYLMAGTLQNRGLLYFMLGRIDELIPDFRRCIQITREFGIPMAEAMAVRDLGEVFFYLGQPEESEKLGQRAAEIYLMMLGEASDRIGHSEQLVARARAYRGDAEGAAAMRDAITKRIERLKGQGVDVSLPIDGKALLDTVGLWLRGAPDEEFDAMVAHARASNLQPADAIEILEFKGLSALRSGRRADGLRFLEDAYAEADKSARVITARIRRQMDQASALAAS